MVKPLQEQFSESGTFVLAKCGDGVVLSETFTAETIKTTFFDNNGTPIRQQFQINFNGVITNTGSGNTYNDRANASVVRDLVNGTQTNSGLQFAITAPERGIVVQDIGKINFDSDRNIIDQHGFHQVENNEVDFCSVLF